MDSSQEEVAIRCLRQIVKGASRNFPVYVGFVMPSDLIKVAIAPAFQRDAAHREIARRVLEPPVSDWQRPLEMDRVNSIAAAFDESDALMPNPVLLSENIDAANLDPKMMYGSGSTPTDVWEIKVPVPADEDQYPLWILDGQHRINGLARSTQKSNPIPVVLLVNGSGQAVYTGKDFAHLFAQVTVTAKGLNPIHQEWLTYAYGLGEYASTDADLHQSAFETVAHLCGDAKFDRAKSNPWMNGITFNPEPEAKPGTSLVGFRYTSIELKDLLMRWYFEVGVAGELLEPEELAEEIALAYQALAKVVKEPQDQSVFFGKGSFAHRVMQDGFLVGVLSRMVSPGAPGSWTDLLKALKFEETDWNFSSWAATRGGAAGNTSRKLAETVFAHVFRDGELPAATDNLADYLSGNNAEVVVIARFLNANGQPLKADHMIIKLQPGSKITRDLGKRRHVKVVKPAYKFGDQQTSLNIGKIEVYDGLRTGKPYKFANALGAGMVLDDSIGDGEASLVLALEHYGAESGSATLNLRWDSSGSS